ncbi:cytochrome c [Cupriavidus plantarum]|uniref:cytochrome c n=1 Tax=Cupriavidus plantarum TaxID=942865 RepID=UPI00339D99B9
MILNRMMKVPLRWALTVAAGALVLAGAASAAELRIDAVTLTTEQLLARRDVKTITVPGDVSYRRTMTYRAVPLRALPGLNRLGNDQDLQIAATDGYVTNLPHALVTRKGGAEPWLAIEPPGKPWPRAVDGKATGPFYLVWLRPEASGVRSEQWPFQIGTIRTVSSRAGKWPQIEVGSEVPSDSVIRVGQSVVATQCMVCHKLNGAGDASLGPDLNVPRSPTEYFQPGVLREFIRNPRAIRAWPAMQMPSFPPSNLSDADLDAAIAYLGYMAQRRK